MYCISTLRVLPEPLSPLLIAFNDLLVSSYQSAYEDRMGLEGPGTVR